MKKYLLEIVETSKKYTLAVAEAMPEKDYDSQLVSGLWNFRELLSHIGYGIHWWATTRVKGKNIEWNPDSAKADKQQVIKYLTTAFDFLEDAINNANNDNELVKGFFATLDHITHHRGQAVVHLRHKELPLRNMFINEDVA